MLAKLAEHLPFEFIKINETPDGSFPNGVPNPLLEHNRAVTADKVVAEKADLGIAWDGDFDRCFFFDEKGEFIEGYYIVGLLAAAFLKKLPGSKIMYDPRLTWSTEEIIAEKGGVPVRCKSGHAFMKECMRLNDVVYGGEMSAHHYFRDFSYCDSGMLPWLLVTELMCCEGKNFRSLLAREWKNSRAAVKLTARLKTAKPYWPPLKKNMAMVKLTSWTGSALNMTAGALT